MQILITSEEIQVMLPRMIRVNQDEIGENELLVVSFGTSFNDSRVKDIKGIERCTCRKPILTGQ